MNINNSLKSLLALTLVCGLTSCQTPSNSSNATESNESTSVHEHTFAEAQLAPDQMLTTVFKDGEMVREYTLAEIRKNLYPED